VIADRAVTAPQSSASKSETTLTGDEAAVVAEDSAELQRNCLLMLSL